MIYEGGVHLVTAEEIIRTDRVKTEKVMHKYKVNQKLTQDELEILRAEVQRLLNETPEDEPIPSLFGKKFNPINYDVASKVVSKLTKDHSIIDEERFRHDAFTHTMNNKKIAGERYGARSFENVDMSEYFKTKHTKNEYFDCYFLKTKKGNPYRAWFHEDYRGIVRYYTKSPYDVDERWAIDAIDFYGAMFGQWDVLDNNESRYLRHMSYQLIREQQPVRYSSAIHKERARMNNLQYDIKERVSISADEDVNKTMYAVLNTLIEESKSRTFEKGHFDDQGRTIFFMSIDRIQKEIKKVYEGDEKVRTSKATISNAVNILAALGFIEKLSNMSLNALGKESLADNRFDYAVNKRNFINYYVIKGLPSIYWVNKQLDKLTKKSITIHNVTKARFERALGKEATDKIFVSGDLYTKKPSYEEGRDNYVREFLIQLKEKGFVTKSELSGIIASKNVENRLWTELNRMVRGLSIRRTNKNIREELGVDTLGGVFVSYVMVHPNEPHPMNELTDTHANQLNKEFEELITEITYWYGDVFWKQRKIAEEKRSAELFEEFLKTGVEPEGFWEVI